MAGVGGTLKIVEQPWSTGHRFRYESEKKTHVGILHGENSTKSEPTYPTLKIVNYEGLAYLRATLVTTCNHHYVHPLELIGPQCDDGIYECYVQSTDSLLLKDLSIRLNTKKDDWKKKLTTRLEKRGCDPYCCDIPPQKPDMSMCCICIELFSYDPARGIGPLLDTVLSQPIYDARKYPKLQIDKISHYSGSSEGGQVVMMFTSEVNQDDTLVRMYQDNNGEQLWERVLPCTVHQKFGVWFTTPPFERPIAGRVNVFIQLCRKPDGARSESKEYIYVFNEYEVAGSKRKRKCVSSELVSGPSAVQCQGDVSTAVFEDIGEALLTVDGVDVFASIGSSENGSRSFNIDDYIK